MCILNHKIYLIYLQTLLRLYKRCQSSENVQEIAIFAHNTQRFSGLWNDIIRSQFFFKTMYKYFALKRYLRANCLFFSQ